MKTSNPRKSVFFPRPTKFRECDMRLSIDIIDRALIMTLVEYNAENDAEQRQSFIFNTEDCRQLMMVITEILHEGNPP